jgi:hypothetical protein
MQKWMKKICLSIIALRAFMLMASDVSNAAGATSITTSPSITNGTVETLPAYIIDICGITYSDTCKATATDAYYKWLLRLGIKAQVQQDNQFQLRVKACVGKTGIKLLNVGSWLRGLTCVAQVGVIPRSDDLKQTFKGFLTTLTQHQPISYVPIAFGFIRQTANDWGTGGGCGSSGLIPFQFTPPHRTAVPFVIPCSPPIQMKVLRGIAVFCVWLLFAFGLYSRGVHFLEQRG